MSIKAEVKNIQKSMTRIAAAFGRLGPLIAAENGRKTEPVASKSGRRSPRLTPAQRKALKLQGQYMGTMRGLKPRQRAQVKRTRAEKGIKAAIREAQRMRSWLGI